MHGLCSNSQCAKSRDCSSGEQPLATGRADPPSSASIRRQAMLTIR